MKTKLIKISSLLLVAALVGCTTDHPIAYGSLGGAAAGAGVGAIVAANSSSISNIEGIGYGALIGIPVGIAAAYVSDTTAKYYVISSNNSAIESNYETIYDNQARLDKLRYEALMERPRGNPDPDLAEYTYIGPRLGNPWR